MKSFCHIPHLHQHIASMKKYSTMDLFITSNLTAAVPDNPWVVIPTCFDRHGYFLLHWPNPSCPSNFANRLVLPLSIMFIRQQGRQAYQFYAHHVRLFDANMEAHQDKRPWVGNSLLLSIWINLIFIIVGYFWRTNWTDITWEQTDCKAAERVEVKWKKNMNLIRLLLLYYVKRKYKIS